MTTAEELARQKAHRLSAEEGRAFYIYQKGDEFVVTPEHPTSYQLHRALGYSHIATDANNGWQPGMPMGDEW